MIISDQCEAEIVADSVNPYARVTTMLLTYPRIVHTHLLTHRMLSKNSSSSRAIPTSTNLKHLREHTAEPVFWGANQPGMQSYTELSPFKRSAARLVWHTLAKISAAGSNTLAFLGAHKQIANRPTEAYSYIRVLVTATEWENWFKLRLHHAADPTIQQLAQRMKEAMDNSTPKHLKPGEWHSPFSEALTISVSCSAQTSYRTLDDSPEKAERVFKLLHLNDPDEPAHSSPTEHQALYVEHPSFRTKGFTHRDRAGDYWSGNLKGWVQLRHHLEQRNGAF